MVQQGYINHIRCKGTASVSAAYLLSLGLLLLLVFLLDLQAVLRGLLLLLALLGRYLHHLGGLLVQVDGEGDELGVVRHDLLQLLLLEELHGVLLQDEGDLGTTAQGVAAGVLGHGERRVGSGLPIDDSSS